MTLKSDASRDKPKEMPRLKRWAAAGALGIATLLGGPSLMGISQAHAQPQVQTDGGVRLTRPSRTPQQLLQTINSLAPAATTGAQAAQARTSPLTDTNPGNLSSTCISIFQVWEVLNSRPAEGDPLRPVYDRAVQAWGGERQAKEAVARSFREAVGNLRERAAARSDCGSEAAGLEYVVFTIEGNLTDGNEQYSRSFDPSWSDVSAVRRVLRGGELEVGLSPERERVAVRPPLPLIDYQLFDPGTDHFLNGFGNVQAVALEGRVTQDLILVFGDESTARNSLNALASAYAGIAGNADASTQADLAHRLHDALSQIPSGKEIWSRTGFQNAMNALARGDLRTGLAYLQGESLLSTAYEQLNNLHQITLSQRALARIRAGVTVRLLNFVQNQEEFNEFRMGTRTSGYNWDILDISLGLHYVNLLVSGYDQRYSVDRSTGTLVAFGDRTRVEGDGHAFEMTPSLTWGANLAGPATMTLFGSFGYRWWEIATAVQTQAGAQMLTASDHNFYVGMWGLHMNFLGYEGRTAPFRLDSAGIGAVGINPLVYGTFAWRYGESNWWRLIGKVTPSYMLFHGERPLGLDRTYFFQHRFGIDVRPIESTHQFTQDWSLMFGPGLRYNLATEFDGVDRIVHTIEPYAYGMLNSQRYGFAVDLRVGGHFEAGGEEWQRLPPSPYGSLNIILTPERWFSGSGGSGSASARGQAEAAPVRARTGARGDAEGGSRR